MNNVHHLHPFIHNIFLRNAYNAAVGRGRVYADGAEDEAKDAFRDDCKRQLTALGVRYYAWEWDLDRYCRDIADFCDAISAHHADVLAARRLRVGTAQKMISLYLKYLWLSGDPSKKPIGAVLDRPILQASGFPNPPPWTKLDDIRTYKAIQTTIARKAVSEVFGSAADWEAEKWGANEDDGEEED